MRHSSICDLRVHVLLALLAPGLAACSSTGPMLELGAPPSTERVQDEAALSAPEPADKTVIAVVAWAEPSNLSGGSEDASAKAARLAIDAMSLENASFVLLEEGQGKGLARKLMEAGVDIVLGGANPAVVSEMAAALSSRQVSTLTLAPIADTSKQIYSAALSVRGEALALVQELETRSLDRIAIVTGAEVGSADLANVIAEMAIEKSIFVQVINGVNQDGFLRGLSTASQRGELDALVFTTSPQRAVQLLGTEGFSRGDMQIAGNAAWALAEPLQAELHGAWYASLPKAALSEFRERYRSAFKEAPTLSAAVLYDLIILAGALSQQEGGQSYSAATLKNASGFAGFTGPFSFGAIGIVEFRSYGIVTSR